MSVSRIVLCLHWGSFGDYRRDDSGVADLVKISEFLSAVNEAKVGLTCSPNAHLTCRVGLILITDNALKAPGFGQI